MRSNLGLAFLVASVALLTGCGGGSVFGESAEPPPVDGTEPARIDLFVSSPQLPSAADSVAEGVTVTALVRDGNNAAISGAQVIFGVDNAALSAAIVNTDADGIAQTVVSTGSDPTNRTVTVTASAGSITRTITITVTGTTISLTGPTNTQFETNTAYTATLLDSSGQGIPNQDVTFVSNRSGWVNPTTGTVSGTTIVVTTSATGQATATFRSTTNATSATLTARALTNSVSAQQVVAISTDSFVLSPPTAAQEIPLGTSQTVTVTWTRAGSGVSGKTVTFSSTRGVFSAASAVTNASGVASVTISSTQSGSATIVASGTDTVPDPDVNVSASQAVEFVATVPASVSLQPDPTTVTVGDRSTLTAIVRDANSNLVKNQTVNFSIDQGSGNLSPGTATTNSQGVAVVTYEATSPSAANGIVIRARLVDDPATGLDESTVTDTATMTVGGAALRIVLGTGNTIQEPSATLYSIPYTVIVTDSNGTAVPSKTVNLSLHSMLYRKGTSAKSVEGVWFRTSGSGGPPIECINEDLLSPDVNLRLDGILNDPANEDLDNDGRLDPENVGTVPPSVVTNASGIANFDVTYLQDRAEWVRVRLRATAAVGGTESVTEVFFDLPGSATDFKSDSPPGFDSPYGTLQDCTLDDENAPIVNFEFDSSSGDEDDATNTTGTTFVIKVIATPPSGETTLSQDIVVPLFYDDSSTGTATRGADYTGPSSVTIPAGAVLESTFTVTMNPDTSAEGTEFIPVYIDQPDNALVGNRDLHLITVIDND